MATTGRDGNNHEGVLLPARTRRAPAVAEPVPAADRAALQLRLAQHPGLPAVRPATVAELHGMELAAYRRAQLAALARRAQAGRRVLAAVGAGPALAAGAEVAHLVPYGVPAALAAGSVPLSVAVIRRLRALREAREDGGEPPALSRWDRASLAVRGAVALWLPTAASVGVWAPLPVRDALLLGWPAAAITYGVRRARLNRVVVPEPIEVVEPEIPEPVRIWADRVGCPGGALPGSYLTNWSSDDRGWSATLELVKGKQHWRSVTGALEAISSAYDVEMPMIVVEPVPLRAAAARIAVYERPPLLRSPVWEGPHLLDLAEGVAPFMTYDDGTTGLWRWWWPKGEETGASGVVHGFVVGTTGSGKSRTLALKLAYERHARDEHDRPLVISWVCDPQGGQSLPRWRDSVDWYGRDMDEIRIQLHTLREIMYDRSRRLADEEWVDEQGRTIIGRDSFVPRPDMPLYRVTIDEAHRVLDPSDGGMTELIDELVRMGRKCGVGVDLATHMPTLGDLRKMSLRGALAGGNVVLLRTGERVSGGVIATVPLPADPYEIPKEIVLDDGSKMGTAGMGYSLGGTGRPVIGRVVNVGDQVHWATTGTTPEPVARDDEVAAAFAGDAYRRRRDRRRPGYTLDDCPRVSLVGQAGAAQPPARPSTSAAAEPVAGSTTTTTTGLEPAPALHLVASQDAGAASPRQVAVKVLRGTGEEFSTRQLARHFRTLTGMEINDNAMTSAMRRAEAAGEVEQLPGAAYGADRSARWRAATDSATRIAGA